MKAIIIITTLMLSACANSVPPSDKYTLSEQKLGHMLDELDDEKTTMQRKKEILCGEFEKEYTGHYMPDLIEYNKATGGETSEQYYQKDLKHIINVYKNTNKVECTGS